MQKSLIVGLAALGVVAVAGAAVWSTGGGDFFKGSLKDLPKAAQQVSTSKPAVSGKTDQFIRVGHKCLTFQPMNLAQKGKEGFTTLVPGTNFLNGVKAVNCDSDAKIKGMTVRFKGANVELNSLKLKKDNVELNSSLSNMSMKMMGDLQTQMKGNTSIERDLEFQFNQPVELDSDSVLSLEADVKGLNKDSHMSTQMMSVDYYDAQMSNYNNTIIWEGYSVNNKDSNMMQMMVDKSGRQNLSTLDAVEMQSVEIE